MRAKGRSMKIEVIFAYILGIAFPVLETLRRGFGEFGVNFQTMADDYIMGAVLLAAAISWSLKKQHAGLFLAIAWAYVLGVMNAPTWGHLEGHLRGIVMCDNDPAEVGAIIGKIVMWSISLISLICAVRSMVRGENAASPAATAR